MPLVEGTSDEALSTGLGHMEGTADPGERGNVVLAGHRVTRGEPLSRMPELAPGDEVVIEHADRVDTYVLDTEGAELVVPLTDTWVTAPGRTLRIPSRCRRWTTGGCSRSSPVRSCSTPTTGWWRSATWSPRAPVDPPALR